MKPCSSFFVLMVGFGLACTAHAGVEQIIKQRARDLRDQNNARQGVPPPSSAPRPAQPQPPQQQAAPAPVPLTAAQQASLRLQTTLSAIRPGSEVTPGQKLQLARDLTTVARGANKPSSAVVAKLAESLSAALSQKLLSGVTCKRLQKNVEAMLNAEKLGAEQINDVIADVQSIFKTNGVDEKTSASVTADLRALAAETGKRTSK